MNEKIYFAIDLKSFYASVECVHRNLDPLNVNLVVADPTRTEKTICLAVTPSLKAQGVSSRPRLFEVIEKVKEINSNRKKDNNYKSFTKKSYFANELKAHKDYELDYIVATPQMKKYMEVSGEIFKIYLQFFADEDIHVYSIDEVFIDVTNYLSLYHMKPEELASTVIKKIYGKTGITATAGIGTNLFLAKVAMDTIAKKAKPNKFGARIAYLDTLKFRQLLWNHTPLTDFWRIGPGITRRLNKNNMFTLFDVAKRSIEDEDSLFNIFGVNAEEIINHAWGVEPTLIKDVKAYKSVNKSLQQGQVLARAYTFEEAKTVIKEMSDLLALDLTKKKLLTDQIVIYIGYEKESNQPIKTNDLCVSYYGMITPTPTGGTINLIKFTSSYSLISNAALTIFEETAHKDLLVRRINIVATHIVDKDEIKEDNYVQLDFFNDYKEKEEYIKHIEHEENLQNPINYIKEKYGKNSIIKGTSLLKEGTARERNKQVGGHKA